ncbi:MAG TPA: hypothetical protein VH302_16325 [Bryobacteraceae bacterium]|nr:hypothetical protein [Bryobacteraceae bacterium]
MRKLLLSCSMALAIAPMALLADQMTGYISDAHCGAAHNSVSDANTKCINKCLNGGSDPVLVSDGKVMKFDADSKDKAKAFAGQNVKIDGSMEGDTVKINSIDKAQ